MLIGYGLIYQKEIKGFPGYEINMDGEVYSKDRAIRYINGEVHFHKGRKLGQEENSHGYPRVTLSINGKSKRLLVSRLVAENFINNPQKLPEVDHINFDPKDNKIDNLQWMTKLENMRRRRRTGRITLNEKAGGLKTMGKTKKKGGKGGTKKPGMC